MGNVKDNDGDQEVISIASSAGGSDEEDYAASPTDDRAPGRRGQENEDDGADDGDSKGESVFDDDDDEKKKGEQSSFSLSRKVNIARNTPKKTSNDDDDDGIGDTTTDETTAATTKNNKKKRKSSLPEASSKSAGALNDVDAPKHHTKKTDDKKVGGEGKSHAPEDDLKVNKVTKKKQKTKEGADKGDPTSKSKTATTAASKEEQPAKEGNKKKATSEDKRSTDNNEHRPAKKQKKAKKKMSFQDTVLRYMLSTCKPFSLKTLAKDLGNGTTEQMLEHTFLTLIDKGLVLEKEFSSKSNRVKKLYWANQDAKLGKDVQVEFPSAEEIEQTKNEYSALQRHGASIRRELASVLEQPSNEDLTKQLANEEAEMQKLQQQLAEMKQRIEDAKNADDTAAAENSTNKGGSQSLRQASKSAATLARERCPRRMSE